MPFTPPDGHADLEAQTHSALRRSPARTDPWVDVEVMGETYRVRPPLPTALHAFEAAISPHQHTSRIRADMTARFVRQHMEAASYEKLIVRMIDPDHAGTMTGVISELLSTISTLGTARPFVPSRRSR
jgi:hypothetical protein